MLNRTPLAVVTAIAAGLLSVGLTPMSSTASTCAPPSGFVDSNFSSVTAKATKECGGNGRNTTRPEIVPIKAGPSALEKYKKAVKAIIARNAAQVAAYNRCFERSPDSVVCAKPKLEDIPAFATGTGKPLGATMPPQLVAYTAAARLKLTPPKPVIGPPPSINPWKIAAVGYPLWLSTDADLDPPAATDSVQGLSVRVQAHLSKVTFAMGDGKQVTCTNLTRAWSRQVVPGTPSPTCGYRYERVPRSGKTYTVTAHARWTVTVTINGVNYPVTLLQHSSTTLPVGELQVVIR